MGQFRGQLTNCTLRHLHTFLLRFIASKMRWATVQRTSAICSDHILFNALVLFFFFFFFVFLVFYFFRFFVHVSFYFCAPRLCAGPTPPISFCRLLLSPQLSPQKKYHTSHEEANGLFTNAIDQLEQ